MKAHVAQYRPLQELFKRAAIAESEEKCFMAHTLARLHDDETHLLLLAFLRPILREVVATNVDFQQSSGDFGRLYRDLKTFVFAMANRVLKPEAIKQTQSSTLGLTELQALQVALQRRENFRALDLVKYGDGFYQTALQLKLPYEKLKMVKTICAEFLVKFTHELTLKLPSCMESVEKMKAFQANVAMGARGRPEFHDLPLEFIRKYRGYPRILCPF